MFRFDLGAEHLAARDFASSSGDFQFYFSSLSPALFRMAKIARLQTDRCKPQPADTALIRCLYQRNQGHKRRSKCGIVPMLPLERDWYLPG